MSLSDTVLNVVKSVSLEALEVLVFFFLLLMRHSAR